MVLRLRLRRRRESECAPLVRPGHRQINETLETEASRQASLDRGLDDVRGQECERQGHPDRALGLALSQGKRFQGLEWLGQQFVQPAMSVAKGVDQNRPRVGAHRPGGGLLIGDALSILRDEAFKTWLAAAAV